MQLSLFDTDERFEGLRLLKGKAGMKEWWARFEAAGLDENTSCLVVACPACPSPIGSRCRRPSGHSGPFVGAHAARWDLTLAEAEGQL